MGGPPFESGRCCGECVLGQQVRFRRLWRSPGARPPWWVTAHRTRTRLGDAFGLGAQHTWYLARGGSRDGAVTSRRLTYTAVSALSAAAVLRRGSNATSTSTKPNTATAMPAGTVQEAGRNPSTASAATGIQGRPVSQPAAVAAFLHAERAECDHANSEHGTDLAGAGHGDRRRCTSHRAGGERWVDGHRFGGGHESLLRVVSPSPGAMTAAT